MKNEQTPHLGRDSLKRGVFFMGVTLREDTSNTYADGADILHVGKITIKIFYYLSNKFRL
ncbi:hypothetical protein GCM10011571_14780 [Marinithermofilum abyssi]|uniref:Uncharacterized protein n=1 Tax=Marinithermofilum abyssi TaxID=1571185 RepID=A0A8J2VI92_9BACL|nr:hypothetical protein GCM10011571_14780 [Marinithermofilum abyssi]